MVAYPWCNIQVTLLFLFCSGKVFQSKSVIAWFERLCSKIFPMNKKRHVDLVVISDVHLGTYGCHAKELLHYLKGIKPKTLVLNGDIIDIWQFSKRYFPKSHLKVLKHMVGL